MFTLEYLLASEWYQQRLLLKQERDKQLWERNIRALEKFQTSEEFAQEVITMNIDDRLEAAHQRLEWVTSAEYLDSIRGSLGADRLRMES